MTKSSTSIVCYGDSNTYGQIPLRPYVKKRYARNIRWTGRVAQALGSTFHVVEEGNNGRTTGLEDPARTGRDGLAYLAGCLDSHAPIDLLVMMLGTNDLKQKYSPTTKSIGTRMAHLVEVARHHLDVAENTSEINGKILLIAPIAILPEYYPHDDFQYPAIREIWAKLATSYERLAEEKDAHFLNAASYATPSPLDGVHMDEHSHARLADAIVAKIQEIFKIDHAP